MKTLLLAARMAVTLGKDLLVFLVKWLAVGAWGMVAIILLGLLPMPAGLNRFDVEPAIIFALLVWYCLLWLLIQWWKRA